MSLKGPIIYVVGFLGSELFRRASLGYSTSVWLHPLDLLTGGFARLRMLLPNEGFEDPKTALIPGQPLSHFYGQLAQYLTEAGYDVWSPSSDWRKPLVEDAERLVALIRQRTAPGFTCQVVCHSRGGLVTRRALAILKAANELWRVRRVVGIGVPHKGSMEAVLNVAGNGEDQRRLEYIGQKAAGILPWGLATEDIVAIMRTWPALYELLPDPERSWLPAEQLAAIYDATKYPALSQFPYGLLLQAAAANWQATPPPDPSVDWIDVVGVGWRTRVSAPDVPSLFQADDVETTLDGDFTVPAVSAGQAGRRRITAPCSHGALVLDGRVAREIVAVLADGLSADVVIEGEGFAPEL